MHQEIPIVMAGVTMNKEWGASDISIVMAGVIMNKEWGASDISIVMAGVIMNKKWGASENPHNNSWCNHEQGVGFIRKYP